MSAEVEHTDTPVGGPSAEALGVVTAGGSSDQQSGAVIGSPAADDGAAMWRVAHDSQVLDLNSCYAYLMWCRCFAETSAVARADGRVVGFVTGYRRPPSPDTLFVWQVAVDAQFRGRNLAARMLHELAERTRCRWLETTISPDNAASIALFSAFARDRGAGIERSELFAPEDFPDAFPDAHEAEDLYRIGPLPGGT